VEETSGLQAALHDSVRVSRQRQAILQIIPSSQTVHGQKHSQPPTYIKTNKFTSSFQGIVDTYGTPRYKEINPGLFTVITFPFLFGVMYGDIGHGFLILIAALLLVLYESKIQRQMDEGTLGEIPQMVYSGRYMLLLMGAFATYCGFVYNDCFSIPWNIFGSSYEFRSPSRGHHHARHSATVSNAVFGYRVDGVYPFGESLSLSLPCRYLQSKEHTNHFTFETNLQYQCQVE
jgi:vacuolar-type H+-ATPase subunit I/STV1